MKCNLGKFKLTRLLKDMNKITFTDKVNGKEDVSVRKEYKCDKCSKNIGCGRFSPIFEENCIASRDALSKFRGILVFVTNELLVVDFW